jgi:hypothetical protein
MRSPHHLACVVDKVVLLSCAKTAFAAPPPDYYCKGRTSFLPCVQGWHIILMIYLTFNVMVGARPQLLLLPYPYQSGGAAPPNSRVPYRAWLLIDLPKIDNGMVRDTSPEAIALQYRQ